MRCADTDGIGGFAGTEGPAAVPGPDTVPDGPAWQVRPRLRIDLLGMTVERLGPDDLDPLVEQRMTAPFERPLAVGSVNLDHVHHFGRSVATRTGPNDVDWLMLIDGAPVARRAHALTGVTWPRLAGADLLPGLLSVAERTGARVGFLGGHEDTVAALRARLDENWPHLDVAGFWTPPRSTIDSRSASQQLAYAIRNTGVDLLVVGLGKPRQEAWIDAHGRRCGAGVLLAFGAAADFLAGSARRAPQWMRNAGLEWLFRLAQEPRRLARRYLLEGPRALWTLRRAPATVGYDRDLLFRARAASSQVPAP